jgi:hypothetical protein
MEWGMRAVQGSFPCLKDEFQYEETGLWKEVLSMFVLLYNYRAQLVGMHQIQSTFLHPLEEDANLILN